MKMREVKLVKVNNIASADCMVFDTYAEAKDKGSILNGNYFVDNEIIYIMDKKSFYRVKVK